MQFYEDLIYIESQLIEDKWDVFNPTNSMQKSIVTVTSSELFTDAHNQVELPE